jgi:hypothetical protein
MLVVKLAPALDGTERDLRSARNFGQRHVSLEMRAQNIKPMERPPSIRFADVCEVRGCFPPIIVRTLPPFIVRGYKSAYEVAR